MNKPLSLKPIFIHVCLSLQLKGGLVMQMSLQVKFYKHGDSQHCDWGSTFHCIEYDCETHTDAGIVAILKETIR